MTPRTLILDPELDVDTVWTSDPVAGPRAPGRQRKAHLATRLAQIEAGEADRSPARCRRSPSGRASPRSTTNCARASVRPRAASLGPELLTPLDRPRDTTTTFAAPPAIEVGVTPTERDLAQVDSTSRTALRDVALAFESTGLDRAARPARCRWDSLAADQSTGLRDRRRPASAAGILAAVSGEAERSPSASGRAAGAGGWPDRVRAGPWASWSAPAGQPCGVGRA